MAAESNDIDVEVGEQFGDEVGFPDDKGAQEAQDNAIKLSCEHMTKFIEELTKCDPKAMSKSSKQSVIGTQICLQKLIDLQDKLIDNELVKDDDQDESDNNVRPKKKLIKKKPVKQEHQNDSEEEELCEEDEDQHVRHKYKKKVHKSDDDLDVSKGTNKSILEILAEKIDNRKVPQQGKYDEDSGETLDSYISRFESYCQDNLRGGKRFWIDELEGRLTGESLKAFHAIKDVGDSYSSLKDKLITWYKDMKDMRKKKAKAQFDKATYQEKESLYLYSTKLEKLFRRAYPLNKVSKSTLLRDKYVNTVPNKVKKDIKRQMFTDSMNDKPTTWDSIQKFARHRDVWMQTEKYDDDSETKDEQSDAIVINVGDVQNKKKASPKRENKIEVEYDESQKKFYICNPNLINLKPPEVQFINNADKQRFSNNSYTRENRQDNQRSYDNSARNNKFDYSNNRSYNQQNYRGSSQGHFGSGRGGNFNNSRNFENNGNYNDRRPQFAPPPNVNIMTCYRCGKMGHAIRDCRVPKCYTCGVIGHISRNCQSGRDGRSRTNSEPPTNEKRYDTRQQRGDENHNDPKSFHQNKSESPKGPYQQTKSRHTSNS